MIKLPSSENTDDFADWAEASCLFGDQPSISRTEIVGILEEAEVPDGEQSVADIWQEIGRRHNFVNSSHPVQVLRGRIERTMPWESAVVYAFQLLLSTHSLYAATKMSKAEWNLAAKLFEELSTLTLERYLSGRAINIGSPREGIIPTKFSECLDYVCSELREDRGIRRAHKSTIKDDKVDIIGWLPFPDKRSGQVIVLGHCAAGRKDWRDKIGEVSIDLWSDYVNWLGKPLTAFIFPFVCTDRDEWWHISKRDRSFLLDRLRIASVFKGTDTSSPVLDKLKRWCKRQSRRLLALNN